MYLFSPSSYSTRAMLHDLLGSYSIVLTSAATSSLLRLKSIRRYFLLCPPPRCLVVMTPAWLRPPFLRMGRSSDFSGESVVMSSRTFTELFRLPGDVGLYVFIAITASLEQIYVVIGM